MCGRRCFHLRCKGRLALRIFDGYAESPCCVVSANHVTPMKDCRIINKFSTRSPPARSLPTSIFPCCIRDHAPYRPFAGSPQFGSLFGTRRFLLCSLQLFRVTCFVQSSSVPTKKLHLYRVSFHSPRKLLGRHGKNHGLWLRVNYIAYRWNFASFLRVIHNRRKKNLLFCGTRFDCVWIQSTIVVCHVAKIDRMSVLKKRTDEELRTRLSRIISS